MTEELESAKKRKRAVALQYEDGEKSARVVATGVGELAKRIVLLAQENNIPVARNDSLVDILSKLEVGYEISPETYQALAEVVAFLYRANQEWAEKMANPSARIEDKSQ